VKNPFVSVIVPCWNEEEFIEKTLDSLLEQDYTNYEIILIDDHSTDNSLKILQTYEKQNPEKIRLFCNTYKDIPQEDVMARRLGIEKARGNLILNFSAHVHAPSNLISVLVNEFLKFDDVVAVSCGDRAPEDSSLSQKAIHKAWTSFWGSIGTARHLPKHDGFVDYVCFGIYKKDVFDKFGGYPFGGDCELNILLNSEKYKKYFTTKTHVYYSLPSRKRNTFIVMFKRMFYYGLGRFVNLRKHPRSFKIFYVIPLCVILALILIPFHIFAPIFLFLYLAGSLFSSLYLSQKNIKVFPLILLSYFVIHIGYGIGFLYGIIRALLGKNEWEKFKK